jgi:iron complex outermembrane receptor protein
MKAVSNSTATGRPRVAMLRNAIVEALSGASGARSSHARSGDFALAAASGAAFLSAVFACAATAPASAQEEADNALEEITVTGSRIRRQDFTANAPITTVDESAFQDTGTIGVETILNQLPQFVPAITQFNSAGQMDSNAVSTVGASTVSLRGLGPNRNLVLIDGRRAMPINPTMVVDTNTIPAAAIERVEVISGGASAVYGADAVGGVVNFILKDDFDGAEVGIRFADTQDGGNQEVSISGLIGLTSDRGNVLLGVERSTRAEQFLWQRDWRVEDYANPNTAGTNGFVTETSVGNAAFFADLTFNYASQNVVNSIFADGVNAVACAPSPRDPPPFVGLRFGGVCPQDANGVNLGVPNNATFFINRTPDGTGSVFTGLNNPIGAAGSYRYAGPFDVGNYGEFAGLPFRVTQPNGNIKENTFYQRASTPLERLSSFAKGELEVTDNVRATAQAMFTRTETRTALGTPPATVTVWSARVPFGTTIYEPSVVSFGADGLPNTADAGEDMTTLPAYVSGGSYALGCPAVGGCTESQAWPLPPEMQAIMMSRPRPQEDVYVGRPMDYMRYLLGDGLGGRNTTTTTQLSFGMEGELSSDEHSWDVTVSTGRTDAAVSQVGNVRLNTYRQLMASPNYGVAFVGNPNAEADGFAEGTPTCTSGLPITRDFLPSQDCIDMLHAVLQSQTDVTQNILEANLVGDLAAMRAGPLGYAVGVSYRENSFDFRPDNLVQNSSVAESIAGVFPQTNSGGEFDVSDLYGELLIPIVSDGPAGVEHFTVELGGRISDWSMPQVDKVETYKALIDWAFTPRYRLRGGFNRALRAPNLGELFLGRTQIFQPGASVFGDQCSQNNQVGPFSANPAVAGAAQAAQTEAICRAIMGSGGALAYYDSRAVTDQPLTGSPGALNSFGNPNVEEETADTFTLGVVMDFLEDWTLTVDYYTIEIEDMIALIGPDTVYETCLSLEKNPSADPTVASCTQIIRNPADGEATNIDLGFTNQGRAKVSGVDLQLNWTKMLASGGFNMNMVANYNILSETQDRPDVNTVDYAGTDGCALQIQCQGYDYRLFTTLSYFRGPWNLSLRHQYWPSILDGSYAVGLPPSTVPDPYGGVEESYQLVHLSAGYSFADKYRLTFGIENLFDEEPPLTGGNPNARPFPIPPSHATSIGTGGLGQGGNSVYEPLGRRAFVSLTMSF